MSDNRTAILANNQRYLALRNVFGRLTIRADGEPGSANEIEGKFVKIFYIPAIWLVRHIFYKKALSLQLKSFPPTRTSRLSKEQETCMFVNAQTSTTLHCPDRNCKTASLIS